eukprot:2991939-Prorocentrum_lima.AAC.1
MTSSLVGSEMCIRDSASKHSSSPCSEERKLSLESSSGNETGQGACVHLCDTIFASERVYTSS